MSIFVLFLCSLYYSCFLNAGFLGPLGFSLPYLPWVTLHSYVPPLGWWFSNPSVGIRFVKGPYGLVGQTFCIANIQLCFCSAKAPTDNADVNEPGCVLVILLFVQQSAGHNLLTLFSNFCGPRRPFFWAPEEDKCPAAFWAFLLGCLRGRSDSSLPVFIVLPVLNTVLSCVLCLVNSIAIWSAAVAWELEGLPAHPSPSSPISNQSTVSLLPKVISDLSPWFHLYCYYSV